MRNKNPYTKKLKIPRFIKIITPPDIWGHVYGLSSFFGLIIAIIVLYFAYTRKANSGDFQFILISLIALITAILLIFFISILYYNKRIKQFGDIPSNYHFYREAYQKQDIIINQISECSHIVSHYYRNLDYSFQSIIDKNPDEIENSELINVINKFDYFLINITTNLQAYFSQITDDNCSITIKILNYNSTDNPYMVKTFFRDPVNFKKRKETDDNGYSYSTAFENTAFGVIIDDTYKNIYFAENDLPDLYNNHSYQNPNPYWFKFYKSTLVVPISIVTGENQRKILGFLSVDNFKGALATNSNKEYLFFVADLLYLAFYKFDYIIRLAETKSIRNEKTKRYTDWN